MIYRCISCNNETEAPKCRTCLRTEQSNVLARRLAMLVTSMREINVPLEYLRSFTEDADVFGPGDDYLITGKERNGLAVAMLRLTMREEAGRIDSRQTDWYRSFRYTSTPDWIVALKASMDAGFSDAPVLVEMSTVPFLVLTDVGSEAVTPWSAAKLAHVLQYRRDNQKATIVTTSLSAAQTKAIYGDIHGATIINVLNKYHQVKA